MQNRRVPPGTFGVVDANRALRTPIPLALRASRRSTLYVTSKAGGGGGGRGIGFGPVGVIVGEVPPKKYS